MEYLYLLLACVLAGSVVPFSSEVVLSIFLSKYPDQFWIMIIVATIGNTIGGMTGYILGYFAKWKWISKLFRTTEKKVQKFALNYQSRGSYLAFFTWLPFFGSVICLSLGLLKSNYTKVVFYMTIGKFIRYIIWAYIFNLQ